jgi:ABC-2 type transport system ATP-binding protein
MRMLTGLLTPSEGSAEVLGTHLPGNAEALKARIGYMTQGFTHYRDLTVLENLRFIAEIHDLPAKRKRRRIDELLDTYDLGAQATILAGSLSGGQRQRLALAATVIHEPELLFLDEPTSAVDPETRRNFWERLFDLVEAGTTMIVSTHLMDEAERCHRIAILDLGRKCADGTPQELMDEVGAGSSRSRVMTCAASGGTWRDFRKSPRSHRSARGCACSCSEDRVGCRGCGSDALRGHPEASARRVRPNLEDVFVLATRGAAR